LCYTPKRALFTHLHNPYGKILKNLYTRFRLEKR
jgi:hypothetical protein